MAKTSNTGGSERVARRSRQAVNKAQADQDAQLIPPTRAEKKADAPAAAARQLARFGDGQTKGGARKLAQAKNKAASEVEAGTLAVPKADPATILAGIEPGQTPSLRQLRLLAKATQRPLEEEAHEIAREAGLMVKNTLLGRRNAVPRSVMRHRRVDQAQRQLASANATK